MVKPATHGVVASRKAPKSLGAYAPAYRVERPGETLFISAQLPLEMPSGRAFLGDFRRQCELVMGHLRSILTDARFQLSDVVQVRAYLIDIDQYSIFDQVYAKTFGGGQGPPCTVVGVSALPEKASVSAELVAVKSSASLDDVFGDGDL